MNTPEQARVQRLPGRPHRYRIVDADCPALVYFETPAATDLTELDIRLWAYGVAAMMSLMHREQIDLGQALERLKSPCCPLDLATAQALHEAMQDMQLTVEEAVHKLYA